jgi:hypothetical protein
MDKLEQEETAATVFSYLIRGLSNGSRETAKADIMEKLRPIRELYGLSDEVYPLYIDQCMRHKKFLKIQEAIEAFGRAIEEGSVSSKEERAMMAWITDVMRTNKTTGNVKTKRR